MGEIIFEITKDHLETGMRGYPVGYCTTSSVDPQKGLFYVGRPLSEIASWSPEEVIYLIYHGQQGSEEEVAEFSSSLAKRAKISPSVIEHIRKLPRKGDPMSTFACALLILGMYEETGDFKEDCLNVIAKLPELAAVVINHHVGWGGTNPSEPSIGYMENFTKMLNVPDGNLENLTEVFRTFNVLHYDHGGGNLSAFTGKAVASGLQGMYGSLASSMLALAGPRHGKANVDALIFVKGVMEELGENPTAEAMQELIKKKMDAKELIYGFGHAVLRVEDVRATYLYGIAEEKYADHPLVKTALLLRSEAPKVLSKNPKIQDPYPNVDAISGTLLTASGFPYSDYYTLLFGLSRCVGIARQLVYERLEAREGKGVPIVRPKYYFKDRTKS